MKEEWRFVRMINAPMEPRPFEWLLTVSIREVREERKPFGEVRVNSIQKRILGGLRPCYSHEEPVEIT